jgi:predicted transcriptional regulator
MQNLTNAQEEIMQLVWDIGECTVGDLRDAIAARTGEKPPHSTVSAVILALDKRGFVTHRTYGRTFVYEPKISREQYGTRSLGQVLNNYFGGSVNRLVTHLVRGEDLSLQELNELVHKLEEE